MNTVLDEVFQELETQHNKSGCNCRKCNSNSRKQGDENSSLQEVQELGWELTGEEEHELSKAFDKIKTLAQKGYNATRPWIAGADIIRRIFSPAPTDPLPVIKDVVTYIEEDKNRQMQANTKNSVTSSPKWNVRQRPPVPSNRQLPAKANVKVPAPSFTGLKVSQKNAEMSILQEMMLAQEVAIRPTLRFGNQGKNVIYLQTRLNYHHASIIPLKEDGIWGKKTHAAVLSFQRAKKLVVDGVVGPKTWAVLDGPAQALVVPTSCKIPTKRPPIIMAEIGALPPTISPPETRACCWLGPHHVSADFADPNKLGTHGTSDQVSKIIYTGKAGFVDLAHLRDMCDLVKFVYDQLKSGFGYNSPIKTFEGEVILKKCPADLLKTARAISYDDSLAHEIWSYWGKGVPSLHNSSFSPEDLCSNNIGTVIGERAILSIEKDPSKNFNTEVTNILNQVIKDLDGQSPTESEDAFRKINGRWVNHSGRLSFRKDDYLKRRNFDLIPWKAGHKSDSPTPTWVLNRPNLNSASYNYRCTTLLKRLALNRNFTNSEFGREISLIRDDAAKLYKADFDKP